MTDDEIIKLALQGQQSTRERIRWANAMVRREMQRDGVHTCHDDCQRPVCVAVREAIIAEREACARVCDEKVEAEYATGKVDHNEMGWTQACAIAIRARGQ